MLMIERRLPHKMYAFISINFSMKADWWKTKVEDQRLGT